MQNVQQLLPAIAKLDPAGVEDSVTVEQCNIAALSGFKNIGLVEQLRASACLVEVR